MLAVCPAQGMEKPIILLSAASCHQNDFIADRHRLLVALTRGRNHLVVIGSADALVSSSQAFAEILAACRTAKSYSSTGTLPLV